MAVRNRFQPVMRNNCQICSEYPRFVRGKLRYMGIGHYHLTKCNMLKAAFNNLGQWWCKQCSPNDEEKLHYFKQGVKDTRLCFQLNTE